MDSLMKLSLIQSLESKFFLQSRECVVNVLKLKLLVSVRLEPEFVSTTSLIEGIGHSRTHFRLGRRASDGPDVGSLIV
jgi:hypothetical protein